MIAWSFSALKTFSNCPRKYNEVNRLKRFKDTGFEANEGITVHQHLENAVKHNTPIPAPYSHYQRMIDALTAIPGQKQPELKMTFTAQMQPTSWFGKDAWLRYAADLLIVDKDSKKAHLVDYKSGKAKYADTEQLKLGAICTFSMHPDIQTVKGALIFTGEEKLIRACYSRENVQRYWEPFMTTYQQLITAVNTDSFAPRKNGLCSRCPVTSCEYHKG
jgi:PD-(D/E)XK nuclease superfamily